MAFMVFWTWYVGTNFSVKLAESSGGPKWHITLKIELDISLLLLASCQQKCMTYTISVCTVKNSWYWTKELSETCKISFQNKFEKLVHLVDFTVRIKNVTNNLHTLEINFITLIPVQHFTRFPLCVSFRYFIITFRKLWFRLQLTTGMRSPDIFQHRRQIC